MFCPDCGAEERQQGQFCRLCGLDLRVVRLSLEKPDNLLAANITAREEIGRAVADKIRALKSGRDLSKVAEEVLPQIEKFLESPAEKRLRRIRLGVALAMLGGGATLAFSLAALMTANSPTSDSDDLVFWFILAGAGFTCLLWGLGIFINGRYFSQPQSPQFVLATRTQPNTLATPYAEPLQITATPNSVIEHTTHSLPINIAGSRDTAR